MLKAKWWQQAPKTDLEFMVMNYMILQRRNRRFAPGLLKSLRKLNVYLFLHCNYETQKYQKKLSIDIFKTETSEIIILGKLWLLWKNIKERRFLLSTTDQITWNSVTYEQDGDKQNTVCRPQIASFYWVLRSICQNKVDGTQVPTVHV